MNQSCSICGRPLRSIKSKQQGYGPVCAKKNLLTKFVGNVQRVSTEDLFSKFIGGIDPYTEKQDDKAIILKRCEELSGKAVEVVYKLSDGTVTKKGMLEFERELLLLYKKHFTPGEYTLLIDMKYHADRVVSIKPIEI